MNNDTSKFIEMAEFLGEYCFRDKEKKNKL